MITFPNCKINLGLHILYKRTDGYHDLETVFYPISLCDSLEIIEMRHHQKSASLPFTSSGLPIKGGHAANLCVKAYRVLKKDFPKIPHVQMHLHKVIPSGAGLGGGSADATFTLKMLDKMFELKLSDEQMKDYARELGSDCPFFLINKACYATGRGEILEEIELDLSPYRIVIVYPGIHVETGDAFLRITPGIPVKSIKEIITQPLEKWKNELQNDFEKPIFKQYREIVDIKDNLYHAGALFASMSGSGSTVFGIFPADIKPELNFPAKYFVKELSGK